MKRNLNLNEQQLIEENQRLKTIAHDYRGIILEKKLKAKELNQKLEELSNFKEEAIKEIKEAWYEVETHVGAINIGRELSLIEESNREKKIKVYEGEKKNLENKLSDKTKIITEQSKLLQEKNKKLTEKELENEQLKSELAEVKKILREKNKKFVESEEENEQLKSELGEKNHENNELKTIISQKDFELYLGKKSLPSLPQKKKNKIFSLKQNKLKLLGNKAKVKLQQLVAKIEVHTK